MYGKLIRLGYQVSQAAVRRILRDWQASSQTSLLTMQRPTLATARRESFDEKV